MRLLRLPLQYPRKAGTLETHGTELAGAATISERMDISATREVRGAACAVDFKQARVSRHVDHIVPARLIRRLKAGNPDRRENLQCICGTFLGY
jgi:hypothetical protein